MLKRLDLMASKVGGFMVADLRVLNSCNNNLVLGSNGYLVTQFLDSTANHRTDKWGGSVENRSRFGLEVLKAVKEVFGRNVSIKLGPAGGFIDYGYYFTAILF